MEKYRIGDSAYVVSNFRIVKVFVTEILTKDTADNHLVRFTIRPYGMKKTLPMEADRLYDTLGEAKDFLLDQADKLSNDIKDHVARLSDEVFEKVELDLNENDKSLPVEDVKEQ
jgi:hypothetical protein